MEELPIQPPTWTGSYGTLDWNADGTYSYTLNNANPTVQSLAAGETLTDSFTYTISDGNGGTDTATLIITVNGTNDGPAAVDDANSVTEDTTPNPVSGDLLTNDSDPDTNDSLTVTEVGGVTDPATDLTGSYGTLDWNADGTYSYTLDNANPTVQSLAAGETLTDSFTYTISDGNGGTDTATLIITVNGTNDGPAAVDDANSVTEDTTPNPVSGDLLTNDSDPDTNDSLTVTEVDGVTDPATDIAGSYGTLDWNSDGTYSYTLDNSNLAVHALADGESLTESFTYSISDGNGGTDTATLIITINGSNDGPTAVDDANSVAEDMAPNPVSGDLLTNDVDPDTNDSLLVTEVDGVTDPATNLTGSYGVLDWNADGTYSYTLDNANPAVQALAVGETLTDSFTYTISDGNGGTDTATLVVTINGSNDGPTAIDDTNAVTEDTTPNPVSGDLLANDSDPDTNDSLTVTEVGGVTDPATDLTGSYGVLDWNTDGTYSYTLDNSNLAVHALADGETLTDSFTYTIDDGNGGTDTATLNITIHGTNDGPSAVDDANSVSEDIAPNPVSGDLLANDSDPDNNDSLTVTEVGGVNDPATDVTGSYGTLDWNADGTYSYTLNNANPAVQSLAAGETLTDSFTYTISDGNGGTDTATLIITINGSNDGPTAVDDSNSVTEDSAPNPVSGGLLANDSDPDTSDSLSVAEIDGVTDPATDVTGSYGVLDWNTDGTYSYTLDNSNLAVHALADGETLTESFTYSISDGNGGTDIATLTITINGTNDGPAAVDDANSVAEDTAPNPVSGDLLANDVDPDTSDSLTVTEVGGVTDPATDLTGSYGVLDWNADGTYSYTLDNANPAVQSLAAGETLTDSFTYTVSDGNGGTDTATLIITISGSNDGPTAVDDTNSVAEDMAPNPVSGGLLANDSDPDSNDSLLVTEVDGVTDPATNLTGSYGILDWNTDGTYSYTLDNFNLSVHALADGETLTESFTYSISDGSGGTDTATLIITINGSNDGPTAIDDTNSVAEDSAPNPVSGDLLANDVDPDTSDSLTVTEVDGVTDPATNINGSYGTLDWNTDGTYSYVLNNANSTVQSLAAGETLTDSFTYTISDGNGGTDTATLIITVNGTNDGPAAVDDANSVTEDTTPNPVSGDLLANDSDPDTSDSLSVAEIDGVSDPGTDIAGSYGTLDWNSDGTYSYTLDNANPAVQSLADGETLTESFTYSISDGNGGTDTATLTITINGTNDEPTAVDDANSVTEDTVPNPVTGDLLSNDSDPDTNDTLVVTEVDGNTDPATDITGSYGTLDWNADGTYSYTLDNANPAVQSLAAGETLTDSFTYTISDGIGGTDTATLIITVNGTNDGPTAVDDANSVTEDTTPNPVSGGLLSNDSDPDTNDSLTVTEVDGVTDPATDIAGSYGTLDWNADGTYSYVLNNSNPTVQSLAAGETLTDSFTYTISDGNGGTDTATLIITINGTNDGPTAVDDANSVTEDTAPNPVSGDLLANDVDPDTSDSLTVTEVDGVTDPATNINGSYGTLDWNTDGTYSYVLNNANSTVQSLAAGETLTDSFTYTISDGNGGTDTATLIITVNGTNDGPIALDDTNSVSEDTAPNPVSGDLLTNDSDPDTDSLTVTEVDGVADPATDIAGSYGILGWNTDGTYSYTLDNANPAVQSLADGETLTESFTYSISDGNGGTDTATLTITINGTNDEPTAVDDANSSHRRHGAEPCHWGLALQRLRSGHQRHFGRH